MINFYQLRAWQLDGVDEREVARRLMRSTMSKDEILTAWSTAFDVSLDEADAAMRRGYAGQVQYDFMRGMERFSDGELDEVGGVLRLALAQVPPDALTATGLTLADIEDDADADHKWWDLLEALGDFEDGTWQTYRYWDLLAEVAVQLEADPAWFRWRRAETLYGFVRAELTLDASAEAVKEQETRPVWVLGEGDRAVASLRLGQPVLEPGQSASVRLRPFLMSGWERLNAGDRITYQQYGQDRGTAEILEMAPPRP
ncbi:hypothetical protein OG205_30470 [Lentzea sp. NBC_00516]|uniref:hypothetical protein n=1 Tax=Lentzea sp. NBC_00516 TaxID=2903582 RepID=UPI002E819AC5|nr:hypothetical protein [Lentzea sp. NBC_00516]WUD22400.1 hypothetical protein OG205_30470 [Lentzea sp. NBC_00516]